MIIEEKENYRNIVRYYVMLCVFSCKLVVWQEKKTMVLYTVSFRVLAWRVNTTTHHVASSIWLWHKFFENILRYWVLMCRYTYINILCLSNFLWNVQEGTIFFCFGICVHRHMIVVLNFGLKSDCDVMCEFTILVTLVLVIFWERRRIATFFLGGRRLTH